MTEATEAELGLRNPADGGTVQDHVTVVRTSAPAETLDAAGVVAADGNLGLLEQDFRSLPAVAFELHPASRSMRASRAGRRDLLHARCLPCLLLAPHLVSDLQRAGRQPRHPARSPRKPDPGVRIRFEENQLAVDKLAEPTVIQRRAFELLDSPIPLTVAWRP